MPGSPNTPSEPNRQRSGSLGGFLSRTKSRTQEIPVVTSPDGHTMLRTRKVREQEERLRQQREERERRPPPILPSPVPLPTLDAFGDDHRPDSIAIISNKASNFSRPYQPSPSEMSPSTSLPILNRQAALHSPTSPSMSYLSREPISPSVSKNGEYVDPQARLDGLNGKYTSVCSSTVSNIHSPRRIRRRRDPIPFNILVMGAKGAGKTSLIDFLKDSLSLPPEKQHQSLGTPKMTTSDGNFTAHYIEAEFDNERVGLTLWDTKGLEKNLVDLQVREAITFIESKFEETFVEESKVMRSPGSKDSHIHCVFLVLDPVNLDMTLQTAKSQSNGNAFAQARGPMGLEQDLDLLVMKGLAGKTAVIPIITKADTLTGPHMDFLKASVRNGIQFENLDPLDFLNLEESESEVDEDEDEPSFETLPIQSPNISHREYSKTARGQFDSDSDDALGPSSPMGKTRSSATTPSPSLPSKRPGSRGVSRSLILGEAVEDMYLPFTVLCPDPYELNAVGRRFPWGMADPFNPKHCDFARLRSTIFSEWRADLRSAAREKWYEAWRTSRLAKNPQLVRPTATTPTRDDRSITGGFVSGNLSPQPWNGKGFGVQNGLKVVGNVEYSPLANAATPTAF
ncbi:hypothetical protein ANO11243_050570 [Dothideomycetidae sp. 11243]|nr:hypothetical protein ANO11243_050570 [fungal sp. No.11243]